MRILELICSSAIGGAENHTRLISKALARKDCEVYLMCPPGDYTKKFEKLEDFGVHVIVRKMSNIPVNIAPAVKRLIKEEKIDIVHTHMHQADLVGALACNGRNNTILTSTIHHMMGLDLKYNIKKYLYYLPVKFALNKMDKIFTVSEYVRQFTVKYFSLPEDRIVTVLNSIDLEELVPDNDTIRSVKEGCGITSDQKVILCIGKLEHRKGQHILIKAVDILKRDYQNIKLLLIGGGPDEIKLKNMVKVFGLDNEVVFLGYQDNVVNFLNIADLFVLPSLHEPLARTLLEAMALGVAVITTNLGGNPEVIKHGQTGMLVKPCDEKGLARCIAEMLNSKERRLAIEKNAMEFIRHNSTMEIMADKTLCEFKKLLH